MQPGETMTGEELQQAARDAMSGHTQEEAAERLNVSRGTVAAALNGKNADRYQKPLCAIVEAFTEYTVEKRVRYAVEEK
jgi:transcriptional regulator with XRE-family HTH domain